MYLFPSIQDLESRYNMEDTSFQVRTSNTGIGLFWELMCFICVVLICRRHEMYLNKIYFFAYIMSTQSLCITTKRRLVESPFFNTAYTSVRPLWSIAIFSSLFKSYCRIKILTHCLTTYINQTIYIQPSIYRAIFFGDECSIQKANKECVLWVQSSKCRHFLLLH